MHEESPLVAANLPLSHDEHTVAPEDPEYFPTAHALWLGALEPATKLPGEADLQEADSEEEYVPAKHDVQVVAPPPTLLYLPAAHTAHSSLMEAPEVALE